MHPYFVSTIVDDHRARLAAEALPSLYDADRAGRGWRHRLDLLVRRSSAPSLPDLPPVPPAPRLAPVLVMAPPFPPGAHGPRPGGAEPPPFDLAS
jgi:hypothetical protein